MSRDRRLGLTAGIALAASAAAALVMPLGAASPAGSDSRRATPTPGSPCVVTTTYAAAPDALLLGESVTHTLAVRAQCPPPTPIPLHVVMVFDLSQAITRADVTATRDAAARLVDSAAEAYKPSLKVAVVEVVADRRPRPGEKFALTRAPLTGDLERVKRLIHRIDRGGETDLGRGIDRALQLTVTGRKPYQTANGASVNEVMIVFSDGPRDDDCPDVVQAARKVKAQGIIVMTVCVGDDCESRCLREAASSARYAFNLSEGYGLFAVFNRIRTDIKWIVLKRLVVTELLPGGMAFVAGSAVPAPGEIDAGAGRLRWEENYVPEEGITITFQARPLGPGHQPVSRGAIAEFTDNRDRSGTMPFPIPAVDVVAPAVAATPTPVRP